jgi:hypothetical protein
MRGVEVEPDPAIRITVEPLESQAEEQTIQLDRDLASSGH